MRLNTRLWSAGRIFAIAACLVATYLLFAVTAMRVALRVREVPVPDLRNHTVAEATAQLQEAGLALTGLAPKDYERIAERQAKKALAAVEMAAGAAGVPCRLESVTEVQPWRGILRVARARKCDALVMASHGRGGLGGLILGSETARVLAHAKIPVLVTR